MQTEIPLSKRKLFFAFGGSVLFVALGVSILFNDRDADNAFAKIVAVSSIVFFGATGIFALVKLFSKKIGLVVASEGITDYSSAVNAGFIPWKDITGIRSTKVVSTDFLLIDTVDNEKYLANVNGFKSRIMRANMNRYGTPITISATALNYDFKALEDLVISEYKKSLSQ